MFFRTRSFKPLIYVGGASACGAGILYVVYRPRDIAGSQFTHVSTYGTGGTLEPPIFPELKSRRRQIYDLAKSSHQNARAGENRTHTTNSSLKDAGISTTSKEVEPYDLLIIGGGATGAGVALDAATRGLKVALVERDDFASGTSSKSTKLVHGGVRYLEKAFRELDYNQYKLVREALRERRFFLDTAPHLSLWLPIMIPVDKWWKVPYFWAGTKIYDLLAGSENIETSYFLTRSKALDVFPMLRKDRLFGALIYYDGAHNDSRMNISLVTTAALYGANTVNYMNVTGLVKDMDGRLVGARVKDMIAERNGENNEFVIRAKGVVNATGPFTDAIRKFDDDTVEDIVTPSSGVHVILPGYFSPSNMGLVDPSTSDGRVIFFLPWLGNTIAGTTDSPTKISQNPVAGEEEIGWILSEIRNYLAPEINVRRSDVLAAWSGIRPLVRDPKAKKTEGLVRNHLITTSDSGLLTISGGKWTTYRQMAEETVDEAIRLFDLEPRAVSKPPRISGADIQASAAPLDGTCQTHQVKLVGAHGFSKTLFINLIQHFGIETEVAKHLCNAYGDRAWTVAALCASTETRFPLRGVRLSELYPFVDGEIRYACRHEYAESAIDVLARRTRLAFLNAQAALEALPMVIDVMTEELSWSESRQRMELELSVAFLSSMGLSHVKPNLTRRDIDDRALGEAGERKHTHRRWAEEE